MPSKKPGKKPSRKPVSIKRRGMVRLLSPFKVQESTIDFIMRKGVSLQTVRKRIAAMKRGGVPLTNLGNKMGMSESQFQKLVERYTLKGGLTQRQLGIKAFCERNGLSAMATKVLVAGVRWRVADLEKKLDFFKAIRLNPSVYGTAALPLSSYEKLLFTQNLSKIARGAIPPKKELGRLTTASSPFSKALTTSILWPLEDKHAATVLDSMPSRFFGKLHGNWRKWRSAKGTSYLRNATLLAKLSACERAGIKPTGYIIQHYSVERIERGAIKVPNRLNEAALERQLKITAGTQPENAPQRALIVSLLASKPHFAARRGWVTAQLQGQGISKARTQKVIQELVDLGLVSKPNSGNGFIRISNWFRAKSGKPREPRWNGKKPLQPVSTIA